MVGLLTTPSKLGSVRNTPTACPPCREHPGLWLRLISANAAGMMTEGTASRSILLHPSGAAWLTVRRQKSKYSRNRQFRKKLCTPLRADARCRAGIADAMTEIQNSGAGVCAALWRARHPRRRSRRLRGTHQRHSRCVGVDQVPHVGHVLRQLAQQQQGVA